MLGRHGDARLKTKMRGIQLKFWELVNMASLLSKVSWDNRKNSLRIF